MITSAKAIVGASLAGTGVIGAGVGGHYIFSSRTSPKTIGEKIENKKPIPYYVKASPENETKAPWTKKKEAYKDGAKHLYEDILEKNGVDEEKLSKKCEEILKTSLNAESSDLNKKVEWATEWCFASE